MADEIVGQRGPVTSHTGVREPGADGGPTEAGEEPRYRDLIAHVPGAVYRAEAAPPWRDLFVSEQVFQLVGYTSAALTDPLGTSFGALILPEDRWIISDSVARATERDSRFDIRYRVRHADGSIRWMHDQGRVICDPTGAPRYLEGVVLDITHQTAAETALRESEARFRTLVANIPGAVYRCEVEWPYRDLILSEGVEAITGYSSSEHLRQLGPDYAGRVFPEDQAWIEQNVKHALATRTAYSLRYRIHHRDGSIRWVQEDGRASYAPDGRPLYLDGVLINVTEQVEIAERLREQEETLRTLVASVPGAVYLCSTTPPWRSSFMSDGVRSVTGHAPEDFLRESGVSFFDLALPEDLPLLDQPVAEAIRSREPFVLRYRIRDAGGGVRWVLEQGRAAYDPQGQPKFLVGVILDVTDRMRVEEELRASQARLVEAQRVAHIGSWELDLRSNALLWSEEIYRIFEMDPARFGATYEAFLGTVHPDDREMVNRAFARAVESRGPYDIVHRLRMPDGRAKFVHERCEISYDAAGTPLRALGTVQDVTERQVAERAREALEAQLRQAQKMEAVGTLAGGIAHDFNNILTAIIGHAELLGQQFGPGAREQEETSAILSASERARDLVQQILTFSRRREREQRPMLLQPVIQEALKLLRASLPTTIEIRLELGEDAVLVSADATEVHQVIVNLCTNAAHAMAGRGGVLTIRYGAVQVDEALARHHPGLRAGQYARLTVTDTGPGMDAATLERIFEPFFTTKGPGQGTGLGLAVVHGIVQNHGGVILVRSRPEEGTAFDIFLPATIGAVPEDAAPTTTTADGHGEHLLLVDDEEMVVTMARRLLTRLGYRVTAFTDPREAIARFEADPGAFDLILTDLTMPELTGLDIAERVRALRPELPVVLFTGYSGVIEPEQLQASGIRDLVGKPFLAGALAETIRRVLHHAP